MTDVTTEPGLRGRCLPFLKHKEACHEVNLTEKLNRAVSYIREELTAKRLTNEAAALTYSTLLAIVPILAVVFAIARGFGYNKYIEEWFLSALSSQPQVASVIVGFVNSYLVHTKSGIFLGVGLLLMFWTVLMLISNIEQAFNAIWMVKHPRSIVRTITDYVALFILVPVFIVLSSGISIFVSTAMKDMESYFLLGPMMRAFVTLLPYLFTAVAFIALYVFMPNTKVKLRHAIIPGILAGVAMQALQLFYIHSQIWVTSYNAIYGSFAALPLFMLWIQISWMICLSGAELCYTSQNLESLAFRSNTDDLSFRYRMLLSAELMTLICRHFEQGEKPYTALELKLETGIPIRITQDLLYDLTRAGLLNEVAGDKKAEETAYQPAVATDRLSVGLMVARLESLGKWGLNVNLDVLRTNCARRALRLRNDYLKRMNDVLFKDLPENDNT